MKELSDFLYLMETVNDNHISILKNVNLSDSTRFLLEIFFLFCLLYYIKSLASYN